MKIIKPEKFQREAPRVSVILPIYSGKTSPAYTRLLSELEKQAFQDFEVVVVSGVSPNGRARNEGVKQSKGAILVFIDETSSLPSEKVLENILAPLDSGERVGLSGASVLIAPECGSLHKQYGMIRGFEVPVSQETVIGGKVQHACMAVRREVFERVGWESNELITGTDNDLRQRISAHGYSMVLVPNTWVYHTPSKTLTKMLRKSFLKGQGSAFAFLKYPGVFELGRIGGRPVQNRFLGLVYRTVSALSKIFVPQYLFNPVALINLWVINLGFIVGWFRWAWMKPYEGRPDLPPNKPPVKILFLSIVELDVPGGPTVHTLNMIKGFREAGADVRLICPKPETKDAEIPEVFCRFIRFYGFGWFWSRLFYIQSFFQILSEIVRDRPDVLYIREMQGNYFPAWASWLTRIPLIVEVNGELKEGLWRRIQFGIAKGIKFNSAALRDEVCRRYEIDREKTEVITMHVDVSRFYPMPKEKCRTSLGILGSVMLIGYCGTFQPSQEFEILFAAMEWLIKTGERPELILIGKGHQFETAERIVRSRGLEKHVRFTGWVAHSVIPHYINAFDVAVGFTKTEKNYSTEALLKLKEYIACGVPVLLNECDRDLFKEYPEGLVQFSRLESGEKVGEMIREIAKNPRHLILETGVAFVQKEYPLKRAAERTIEFFTRMQQ